MKNENESLVLFTLVTFPFVPNTSTLKSAMFSFCFVCLCVSLGVCVCVCIFHFHFFLFILVKKRSVINNT